jgi:hypothetical protein
MNISTEQDKRYLKDGNQLTISTVVDNYRIQRLSILGIKAILLIGTWDFSDEDNSALILTI